MIAYRPPVCKGVSDSSPSHLVVGDLALRTPTLDPEDTIARAAEAVRQSGVAAVPVVEDGRIVGVVSSTELKAVLAGSSTQQVRALPVRTVMATDLLCLREGVTLEHALETFQDHGVDAAPVLDDMGRCVGMVGTAGLLSAACGKLRPPAIGGLATPLGVYLTSGSVRAGVGDLGLASAGLFIGLLQLVASWCAFKLAPPLADGLRVVAAGLAGALPPDLSLPMPERHWLYAPLSLLLFGVFFRWSWVTGLHAAEHQVVHAIEMGDDLTPEAVRRKPRVHPRCGTNLVAAFGTFMLLRGIGNGWDVLAFPVVLLTWRVFGAVLQQHVTTRPATPDQLANGIAAGRQLLDRYQLDLKYETPRWRRIWNMGLLQVALGFACLWFPLVFLKDRLPLDPDWLHILGF